MVNKREYSFDYSVVNNKRAKIPRADDELLEKAKVCATVAAEERSMRDALNPVAARKRALAADIVATMAARNLSKVELDDMTIVLNLRRMQKPVKEETRDALEKQGFTEDQIVTIFRAFEKTDRVKYDVILCTADGETVSCGSADQTAI